MSTTKPAGKPRRFGLVLNLPGAPATPHEVAGLPGRFRPDQPVPLEELGLSVAEAELWIAEHTPPAHTEAFGRDEKGKTVVVGKIPLDACCPVALVPLDAAPTEED